jgi:hypothetical protein
MKKSGPATSAVLGVKNVMDGRAGFRLRADWGHISVLEGGGHICELNLNACSGVNPLWRPPWATIDPFEYTTAKYTRKYGPPPDGRLLSGIAGHSLSFDHFGPPSPEETAAGLTTHGEAPVMKWRARKQVRSKPQLQYGCTLSHAQIGFARKLTLDPISPVIYCEETAVNLSRYDRPISWNEHVTFGPPFLEAGTTWFDMPATRAKVCPASYSPRFSLQPNAEFTWPNAPTKNGKGRLNLRTTPAQRFGHYTAQLLSPKLEIGFIAACNPRLKVLVVYAFRRADFPWVGNWEERYNRTPAPWRGKTFCRGLEFSTTPFSIPRRETIKQGPLFGELTHRWLPAKSQVRVRFLILLFAVPATFRGVASVSIASRKIDVVESGARGRRLSVAADKFL